MTEGMEIQEPSETPEKISEVSEESKRVDEVTFEPEAVIEREMVIETAEAVEKAFVEVVQESSADGDSAYALKPDGATSIRSVDERATTINEKSDPASEGPRDGVSATFPDPVSETLEEGQTAAETVAVAGEGDLGPVAEVQVEQAPNEGQDSANDPNVSGGSPPDAGGLRSEEHDGDPQDDGGAEEPQEAAPVVDSSAKSLSTSTRGNFSTAQTPGQKGTSGSVVRESSLDPTQDLGLFTSKVKSTQEAKALVRDYISAIEDGVKSAEETGGSTGNVIEERTGVDGPQGEPAEGRPGDTSSLSDVLNGESKLTRSDFSSREDYLRYLKALESLQEGKPDEGRSETDMTGAKPNEIRGFENDDGTKAYVMRSDGSIGFSEFSKYVLQKNEIAAQEEDSESEINAGEVASEIQSDGEASSLQNAIQDLTQLYQVFPSIGKIQADAGKATIENLRGDATDIGDGALSAGTMKVIGSSSPTMGGLPTADASEITDVRVPDISSGEEEYIPGDTVDFDTDMTGTRQNKAARQVESMESILSAEDATEDLRRVAPQEQTADGAGQTEAVKGAVDSLKFANNMVGDLAELLAELQSESTESQGEISDQMREAHNKEKADAMKKDDPHTASPVQVEQVPEGEPAAAQDEFSGPDDLMEGREHPDDTPEEAAARAAVEEAQDKAAKAERVNDALSRAEAKYEIAHGEAINAIEAYKDAVAEYQNKLVEFFNSLSPNALAQFDSLTLDQIWNSMDGLWDSIDVSEESEECQALYQELADAHEVQADTLTEANNAADAFNDAKAEVEDLKNQASNAEAEAEVAAAAAKDAVAKVTE